MLFFSSKRQIFIDSPESLVYTSVVAQDNLRSQQNMKYDPTIEHRVTIKVPSDVYEYMLARKLAIGVSFSGTFLEAVKCIMRLDKERHSGFMTSRQRLDLKRDNI
jgi:protein gp37